MGWLGAVLALVVIVNTVCGTVFNISSKKEVFSWGRLFKGLGKSLIFYVSATLMGVACTMLPYINEMITKAFGTVLLSNDILTTLSSVGVLGVVVAAIVSLGKKAIANVVKLANMAYETEEITWNVEEE